MDESTQVLDQEVHQPEQEDSRSQHEMAAAHAAALAQDGRLQAELTYETFAADEHMPLAQANMLDGYLRTARAGSWITDDSGHALVDEDAVWDKVFELQLDDLHAYNNPDFQRAVAANMLIANLCTTSSHPHEERERIVRERMWAVAQSGYGGALVKAAGEYADVTLRVDGPGKTRVPVGRQVRDYEGLLILTDQFEDAPQGEIDLPILETATPDQQEYAMVMLASKKGLESMAQNLRHIPDKRPLFEKLIDAGMMSPQAFEAFDVGSVISPREAADRKIAQGMDPFHTVPADALTAEDQVELFNQSVAQNGTRVVADRLSYSNDFSKLGAEQLDMLLADPGINKDLFPLKAFRDLPAGYLKKVQAAGVSDAQISQSLKSFEPDERVKFYEGIMTNPRKFGLVAMNPDQFDFLTRDQILEKARLTDRLDDIAVNITKYTDGSDKALLQEMFDAGQGAVVARRIHDLPKADISWFRGLAEVTDNLEAMVQLMPYDPTIDQEALLAEVAAADNAGVILQFNLRKFDRIDPSDKLDLLIAAKQYYVVAGNARSLGNIPVETVLERLSAVPDAGPAIAANIFNLPVDIMDLSKSLADHGHQEALGRIAGIAAHAGVDSEWILQHIKDSPEALYHAASSSDEQVFINSVGRERLELMVADQVPLAEYSTQMFYLHTPEAMMRFAERCIGERDVYSIRNLVANMPEGREIIQKRLCEEGWQTPMLVIDGAFDPFHNPNGNFPYPDYVTLMEWGAYTSLLGHADMFPQSDRSELYTKLAASGDAEALAAQLTVEKGQVPIAVAEALVGTPYAFALTKQAKRFNPEDISAELIEKCLQSDNAAYAPLYEQSGQHIDYVERAFKVFGGVTAPGLVLAIREINTDSNTPLPDYMLELGVTDRGQLGQEQMKRVIQAIRNQLLVESGGPESEEFIHLVTTNPLAMSIAKHQTRFSDAEWGTHEADEWEKVLSNYLSNAGKVAPMSEVFKPSPEYAVRSIDAKEFDPRKLDEDAVTRYEILRESLEAALAVSATPGRGRYEALFSEARGMLSTEIGRLQMSRQRLAGGANDKAVRNLDERIGKLTAVRDMSARDFVKSVRSDFGLFTSLNVRGLEKVMRAGIFARAISRSPQARMIAQGLRGEEATYDNLVAMNNFVEHIVNQEVYGKYFSNLESAKVFRKLSDTQALRNQISKTQAGATSGTTTLQILPSRGLLLELSGHIGDACWASEYPSIAKEFPDMTALTFIRNRGKPTERMVGAALIMETTDENTGEAVVVLRGINPIENYINGVKAEDFFEGLLDYAKQVAGKRRIAMVFDDRTGGALTNRPALLDYIQQNVKKDVVRSKPLKLPESTTFNGYTLSASGYAPAYYLT